MIDSFYLLFSIINISIEESDEGFRAVFEAVSKDARVSELTFL